MTFLMKIMIGLIAFVSLAHSATYTSLVYSPPKYGFYAPLYTKSDPQGNIWVLNRGEGSVIKMIAVNNYKPLKITHPSLSTPTNMAIDSKGNVWITDLNNLVIKIPQAYPNAAPIVYSDSSYSFNGPQGIMIDSQDNVWVANSWGNTVTKMDALNNYQAVVIGPPNYGSFSFPQAMVRAPNGDVWVNTNYNYVVIIPNGDPSQAPMFANVIARTFVIDSANNVWAINDAYSSVIPANNPTATPTVYNGLSGMIATVDSTTGHIWTTNYLTNTINEFDPLNPSNKTVYQPPQYPFDYPAGISVDNKGDVWVANSTSTSSSSYYNTVIRLKKK